MVKMIQEKLFRKRKINDKLITRLNCSVRVQPHVQANSSNRGNGNIQQQTVNENYKVLQYKQDKITTTLCC